VLSVEESLPDEDCGSFSQWFARICSQLEKKAAKLTAPARGRVLEDLAEVKQSFDRFGT
jgi:hypothetical protein